MCGRYYIPEPDDDDGFREIHEHIKKVYGSAFSLSGTKRGEIFPTDIVPVITEKEPALMKWGFSRFDGKGQVINARLETAGDKPMFKKSYHSARCLIPAAYYFEWRKDGAHKTKYAIGQKEPIYMAGLYKYEADASLPQFVILTRPAAPEIMFIHNRMPVIVPESVRQKWLSAGMKVSELMELSDGQLSFADIV